MQLHERESTSIAALHDLHDSDFETIQIEVRRRFDVGLNKFEGCRFLSGTEEVCTFETLDDAFAFIDDLQAGGLPFAIRNQVDEVLSNEDIFKHLHVTCDHIPADTFIEESKMDEPLKLNIIPHVTVAYEFGGETAMGGLVTEHTQPSNEPETQSID